MPTSFPDRLAQVATAVETKLDALLPDPRSNIMAAPMRHATMNGGKRLRAFLVVETAALFDVPQDSALRTAAAIESMHAYSLVHDDLPCMDDDDLRRGKPTVHVKWDDATAVLAGDALQTLAFEILADVKTTPDPSRRLALITSMAKSSGANGMVLGQAQDIAAETALTPLTLPQITELQANKTGALICWSAQAGALLAGETSTALRDYAVALGLAFQIHDDVLDVLGDAETAGKRLQKDADAGKATFVSLLGLEQAQKRANSLVKDACDALAPFRANVDSLRQVAQFVVARNM